MALHGAVKKVVVLKWIQDKAALTSTTVKYGVHRNRNGLVIALLTYLWKADPIYGALFRG